MNMPRAWYYINLFRSVKRLLYYHWMKKDQLWSYFPLLSSHTAYNPCTGYPTNHSQIARYDNAKFMVVDVGLDSHDLGPQIPSKHL